MKKTALIILGLAATFCLGFSFKTIITKQIDNNSKIKKERIMKLGAFSVSLNVKDINVSKQFYENLGFKVFAGGMEKNYLIMKNENSLIGLFQGMFKGNILTFNPGWDENAKNIEEFDDVREIQRQLKNKGIKLTTEADDKTSGLAGFMITDPDGNVVLIDQHR
ncbi:VOC family protein [Mucilaginibacter sp.]|uniref:VOC family protein n=1 Tax=Mucilaginibacter sp. TaxID=1882438 RepID=UPI0026227A13|nr:VOC family protein [Mucilaginibacter sp.]MDB4920238.1 glyoxalase [Mucilaginibacter sp.]